MLHVAVTPIQCNHPTLSTSSPQIRTLKTLWAIFLQIFGSLKVENARSHTTLHTYLIHRTILYLWYLCVCANFVIKHPNDWTLKECQFKTSHAQHVLQCSSCLHWNWFALKLHIFQSPRKFCSNQTSTNAMDNHLLTSKPFCLPFHCLILIT